MSAASRAFFEKTVARPLVIVGLRRSGTTALWETLRRHPGLVAFDEPFHPRLWQGMRESTKGTWTELTALWRECPSELASGARPIEPLEELERTVDDAQATYFTALLSQNGGQVVTDVVRTWNKMGQLASVTPQPYVVQLVRSPVPWVLSHILPSGKGSWRKPVGDALRRLTALKRKGCYNNWQYETIINEALATSHPLWRQVVITPDRLAVLPAHVKLLAFWWAANRTMANDLASAAPGRHQILLLDEFTASPDGCLTTLLASAGLPITSLDTSAVHCARHDSLQEKPAFAAAFDTLGVPRTLLPAAHPTSKTLAAAFSLGCSSP